MPVEATYRSILLLLQADVAQTCFRRRALDAELATIAQTVRPREENMRVNGRRFELGVPERPTPTCQRSETR